MNPFRYARRLLWSLLFAAVMVPLGAVVLIVVLVFYAFSWDAPGDKLARWIYNKVLPWAFKTSPQIAKDWGVKDGIVVAEMSLDERCGATAPETTRLPGFSDKPAWCCLPMSHRPPHVGQVSWE